MLKQRILTALILIPIFVATVIYLPPPSFLLLTAFITFMGAWEWAGLMGLNNRWWKFFYLLIIAVAAYMAIYIHVQLLFGPAFIFWLLAFIPVVLYPRANGWWSKGVFVRGLMGVFVLVPCWAAVNFLRNQDNGLYILLFLFVLIWGADSAAYFVGRKWGKTKLAPLVSPAKSVEGMVGAVIFAIVFALLAMWFGHIPEEIWPWGVALSLITVLFSILGDLFESMLKRQVGVKDSGRLLPGHGGVLDRIDSLTAAAPIFAFGGLLLGAYF